MGRVEQPEALAPLRQVRTQRRVRQPLLEPFGAIGVFPGAVLGRQRAMHDGKKQAVQRDEVRRRSFSQRDVLAGTEHRIGEAHVARLARESADGDPRLVEQVERRRRSLKCQDFAHVPPRRDPAGP